MPPQCYFFEDKFRIGVFWERGKQGVRLEGNHKKERRKSKRKLLGKVMEANTEMFKECIRSASKGNAVECAF